MFKKKFAIFILLITLLYSRIALAKIIEVKATGTHIIDDGTEENISIAKERARLEAKRAAVEQAGVFIESYSVVNNMTLIKDEIRMITANILRIKSEEFIVNKQENNFIVFICKIIADIDTDSVYMTQSRELNALKTENAQLRQMIVELQHAAKELQNTLALQSSSKNIEKTINYDSIKQEQAELLTKQQKEREQAELLAKQRREREQAELLAKQQREREQAELLAKQQKEREQTELLAKQQREREQAELLAKQQREHNLTGDTSTNQFFKSEKQLQKNNDVLELDNIVLSLFPDKKDALKLDNFVPRPSTFISPTKKVSMRAPKVVPNPQKWTYMFYNKDISDGQPVWYSPSSIKLIKLNGNLKVSFTILRYRESYDNYFIQNILIDYTNGYYMVVDKKFFNGSNGENFEGRNFDNVQKPRKINVKDKEAINYASYVIKLISANYEINNK